MNRRPRFQTKAFDPNNPRRFAGNAVTLVALLLVIAYGLDLVAVELGAEPVIYCWMVVWASQYGIGGSLALIMAFVGFIVWIVSRNAKAGAYLIGGAILIKLMPLLLGSHLGIGMPCALG